MMTPSSTICLREGIEILMARYHARDDVTSRLRLRGFDYAAAASYFVTICAERHTCLFGEVEGDAMRLSHAGVMLDSWWHMIPRRFPSVALDAMVVMPNHIHGIVHIGTVPEDASSAGLSTVMHWFKTRTTYDYTIGVRTEGWPRFPGRLWQTGYYDHIIRNERALEKVRAYIDGNPGKWAEDDYNLHAST